MSKLFGFSIKKDETDPIKVSPVPPNNDDGAIAISAGGHFGYSIDLDKNSGNEYELIRRYRGMALHPEIDQAIEDIVNEAIVSDTNDTPVNIELSNLDVSERVKEIIREEFKYLLSLLDFNNKCHEIFRKWYIDGRIYYHKVIDLNRPERGIIELRNIDAMKIKPVRERIKPKNGNSLPDPILKNIEPTFSSLDSVQFGKATNEFTDRLEEYFIYNKKGFQYFGGGTGVSAGVSSMDGASATIKIAKDAITYVTSGLVDGNTGMVLSYLNKAIKALNQLRMLEDSVVIYRVARAPERRTFYIDVGNLPKSKAEQYMRDVMNRYKTKVTYDQATGEIKDERKFMSMLEDYWLPRREGGRGTEIGTLPGGANLGELGDLKYFKDKLLRSLNLPPSRQDGGGEGFQLGRSNDILRDEIKFSKFVGRMRKRFSNLFLDILKTQLILKGICSPSEFEQMKEHIQFDYLYDNHFDELKKIEISQERLNMAAQMDPYIGKYYSVYYVRNKVLRLTDEEIKEMDLQIQYERQVGIIPNPDLQMNPDQQSMEGLPTDQQGMEGEPPVDGQGQEPPAQQMPPTDQMQLPPDEEGTI
jgi:hypothetical protein